MSDTTDWSPTDQRPTNDQPTDQGADQLTIRQAAERLGLSENAVRLRIRRGTLPSVKVAGVVHVLVGDQPTDQPGDQPTKATDQPTNETTTSSDPLVEQLRAENARLWSELEARRESERELRIIVANLTRALPAPGERVERPETAGDDVHVDTDVAEPQTPQRGPQRPWWRFWEREEDRT